MVILLWNKNNYRIIPTCNNKPSVYMHTKTKLKFKCVICFLSLNRVATLSVKKLAWVTINYPEFLKDLKRSIAIYVDLIMLMFSFKSLEGNCKYMLAHYMCTKRYKKYLCRMFNLKILDKSRLKKDYMEDLE